MHSQLPKRPTTKGHDLPPVHKQRNPSKSRASSPDGLALLKPAVGSSSRGSLKFDPDIYQSELETLENVSRRSVSGKGSSSALAASPDGVRLSRLGSGAGGGGGPHARTKTSDATLEGGSVKGVKLELPFNSKRPISAPAKEGATASAQIEEAQIHAAFLGNNLKSKKSAMEQVISGDLASVGEYFVKRWPSSGH
ncbi:hypothetical protein BC830DRAFT_130325 [Chytriomyces sp. MP71]|nr:hypothetical protein BC830DRAFT_130325 [Chytriomyces sp. MP71]